MNSFISHFAKKIIDLQEYIQLDAQLDIQTDIELIIKILDKHSMSEESDDFTAEKKKVSCNDALNAAKLLYSFDEENSQFNHDDYNPLSTFTKEIEDIIIDERKAEAEPQILQFVSKP